MRPSTDYLATKLRPAIPLEKARSSSPARGPTPAGSGSRPTAARLIQEENFDRSVKPGQDFYRFTNGGWLKNNPIPPSEPDWDGFREINRNNQTILKAGLEELARAGSQDPTLGKLGTYYRSGMKVEA